LKDRVREVLLIGAAADRIAQELSGAGELIRAGNLESAVLEAFHCARPGDVVLLAPACSSFDQFQDYEHRGRVFKEVVERLAQDVESGVGLDVSGQLQAESPAGSSEASPGAGPEPPAETLVPEVEEVLNPVADGVDGETERRVTNDSATENWSHEPTLVYEISAEELPPAEIEPAQDYSVEPETSQPQAPCAPEGTDDAQLPYEARADEKGVAAHESAGREFAEGGSQDMPSPSEPSAAITARRKPRSAAPDSAPQPRLPGMD